MWCGSFHMAANMYCMYLISKLCFNPFSVKSISRKKQNNKQTADSYHIKALFPSRKQLLWPPECWYVSTWWLPGDGGYFPGFDRPQPIIDHHIWIKKKLVVKLDYSYITLFMYLTLFDFFPTFGIEKGFVRVPNISHTIDQKIEKKVQFLMIFF